MSQPIHLKPENLAETFMNLEAIRLLIRKGLGCDCPEEVFDEIVVGYPSVFGSLNMRSSVQVLVGHRLLVSLIPVRDLQDAAKDGKQLLLDGKRIRDRNGLNRYRLVFVGHVPQNVMDQLRNQAASMDDRMHVHLIEPVSFSGTPPQENLHA